MAILTIIKRVPAQRRPAERLATPTHVNILSIATESLPLPKRPRPSAPPQPPPPPPGSHQGSAPTQTPLATADHDHEVGLQLFPVIFRGPLPFPKRPWPSDPPPPSPPPPEPPRDSPAFPQDPLEPPRRPTPRWRRPRLRPRGRSPVVPRLSFTGSPDIDARIQLRLRRMATLQRLDRLYKKVKYFCTHCKVTRAVFDRAMKELLREGSLYQLGINPDAVLAEDSVQEFFLVRLFVLAQDAACADKRKTIQVRDLDLAWASRL
ncbi:hypothetical protein HNY73_008111 [Argiope bruennichi]|uniref:Core Histone H2A/H2B/H3 domain-containing protein n=1 Tax=Argiope bruennichi TaxID=94029 RepID=A0A8T0FAJ8_ARGBR|nr:hypothetical protein HNY73_008111 [Argiope bruennichi]